MIYIENAGACTVAIDALRAQGYSLEAAVREVERWWPHSVVVRARAWVKERENWYETDGCV